MKVMKFKDWIKLIRESIKDSELNRILDKISRGSDPTPLERKFLDRYDSVREEELKDFTYLSKDMTYQKIREILDQNKKIVCDLYDDYGKIGLYIKSIENNYEEEICILHLKGGTKSKLSDNFLYNLIYNLKKEEYSLQVQDEYFEPLHVKNEDN